MDKVSLKKKFIAGHKLLKALWSRYDKKLTFSFKIKWMNSSFSMVHYKTKTRMLPFFFFFFGSFKNLRTVTWKLRLKGLKRKGNYGQHLPRQLKIVTSFFNSYRILQQPNGTLPRKLRKRPGTAAMARKRRKNVGGDIYVASDNW